MLIFWEKSCYNRLSVERSTPIPQVPRVVIPANYYSFVEFVSSAKCVLFPLTKRTK